MVQLQRRRIAAQRVAGSKLGRTRGFFYLNFPLSEKLKLTFNPQNATWVIGAVVKDEGSKPKGRTFGIPPG